jgi:hypothetical protein
MKPRCYICDILGYDVEGVQNVAFYGEFVWVCTDCLSTYKQFIDGNAKGLSESNVSGVDS